MERWVGRTARRYGAVTGLALAGATLSLSALAATPGTPGAADPNANWPCVQHKVEVLSALQMWDGPTIDLAAKWWEDDPVRKLVPILVSRRIELPEAEKAIEALAKSMPETERDARLTLLFTGVLDETNKVRKRVIQGIERFQERQVARARQLEEQGIRLADLHKRADKGEAVTDEVDRQQQAYDWDARVFKERQDNLPLACEVPQLIEQRIFAIARAIRAHMS
ncbi:MAG: hypothetical protein NW205_03610 [Hyphomicrobiaceae bacterium]|nr:hypothetical protein [Hyphomicrobiaceae bacterium]